MREGGGSYKVYLEDALTYKNMLENAGFRIEKVGTIESEGTFEKDSKMTSFNREFIVIVALKE